MSNELNDLQAEYNQAVAVIAAHRRNIKHYLGQVKAYGGFDKTPINIINALISSRQVIYGYIHKLGTDMIPFEDNDVYEDYLIENGLVTHAYTSI